MTAVAIRSKTTSSRSGLIRLAIVYAGFILLFIWMQSVAGLPLDPTGPPEDPTAPETMYIRYFDGRVMPIDPREVMWCDLGGSAYCENSGKYFLRDSYGCVYINRAEWPDAPFTCWNSHPGGQNDVMSWLPDVDPDFDRRD